MENNDSNRQVMAMCNLCGQPIYVGDQTVEHHKGRLHSDRVHVQCEEKYRKDQFEARQKKGIRQRKSAFIWSSVVSILVLVITLVSAYFYLEGMNQTSSYGAAVGINIAIAVLMFCFVFCLVINNNYMNEFFVDGISLFFVRMPGVVFSFDLDGFIGAIVIKICLFIIGFVIVAFGFVFMLGICLALSIFTFPYALRKSLNHPEESAI